MPYLCANSVKKSSKKNWKKNWKKNCMGVRSVADT